MSNKLRILFAGTPNFAAHHLNTLLLSNYQIIGVFTQPDRPSGRGRKITSTPVKLLAEKYKLPIFQPISLYTKESQQIVAQLDVDLIIVVAYSLIVPKTILEIPRLGCINVHGSLLPRWRGAAPIQRALWAGDVKTGITIIQMDTGLDTGDILYKAECPIDIHDTSDTLNKKLAELGSKVLLKILSRFTNGDSIYLEKQNNEQVTYAKKLSKEEARINWLLPVIQLERCIRAFNPWPVSWLQVNEQLIKVWKASIIEINQQTLAPGTIISANKHGIQVVTLDGIINLELLQLTGRNIMHAKDLLNSRHEWFISGKRLT